MEDLIEKEIFEIMEKNIDLDTFSQYYAELKYRLVKTANMCEVLYVQNKEFDCVLFDSICLQLRKMLELIAMISLIHNKEAFLNLQTKIFDKWRGKDILEEVSKYSHYVFPVESFKYYKFDGSKHSELKIKYDRLNSGLLNKELFCEIYDNCSDILHIHNPYSSKDEKLKEKVDYISKNIGDWLDSIFITYSFCRITPYGNEKKLYTLYMGELKDTSGIYLWQGFTF